MTPTPSIHPVPKFPVAKGLIESPCHIGCTIAHVELPFIYTGVVTSTVLTAIVVSVFVFINWIAIQFQDFCL